MKRAKLMEVVKTVGKGMVPRAGVEPARPFGQRILSPQGYLPSQRIPPSNRFRQNRFEPSPLYRTD